MAVFHESGPALCRPFLFPSHPDGGGRVLHAWTVSASWLHVWTGAGVLHAWTMCRPRGCMSGRGRGVLHAWTAPGVWLHIWTGAGRTPCLDRVGRVAAYLDDGGRVLHAGTVPAVSSYQDEFRAFGGFHVIDPAKIHRFSVYSKRLLKFQKSNLKEIIFKKKRIFSVFVWLHQIKAVPLHHQNNNNRLQ